MSSGLGGGVLVRFGADDLVDVAGDVALEAAHDLGFWFAFGEASGHIFLCGFVPAEADHGDAVQAGVGLPVAAAVSRTRLVLPEEAGMGLTPQRAAKAASEGHRCGLSPAASRIVAALAGAPAVDA